MANPFGMTKNYFVTIKYITAEIQRSRRNTAGQTPRQNRRSARYAQSQLAADLREITGVDKFNSTYVNEIMNGHRIIENSYYEELTHGLQSIMKKYNIPVVDPANLPLNIYVNHEPDLYLAYDDDGPHEYMQSRNIGVALSESFSGMWRFFYTPPEAIARGNLVTNLGFFHNSGEKATTIRGILFVDGEHSKWSCIAKLNTANFIEMSWINSYIGENGYTIAVLPSRIGGDNQKIGGVTTFLEQKPSGDRRAIISTVFFGYKCTPETCGFGEGLVQELSPNTRKEIMDAANKAINGENLSIGEQNIATQWFRFSELKVGDFKRNFVEMLAYVRHINENHWIKLEADALNLLIGE